MQKNVSNMHYHVQDTVLYGQSGVCRIELKVLSNNETALHLYEKLSFKETKKYMAMDLWEH